MEYIYLTIFFILSKSFLSFIKKSDICMILKPSKLFSKEATSMLSSTTLKPLELIKNPSNKTIPINKINIIKNFFNSTNHLV